MEILEDVSFDFDNISSYALYLPSSLSEFKLKDNYIDNLNKEEYLNALKNNKLEPLFGKSSLLIKEPNETEFKKITSSNINVGVNKSYVFGESSTGTVKVVYVDENNKEFAPAETIAENQPWYNKIEIPKKEFDGYEFVSTSSPLKDLVMPGERTVTLKYKSTEKTREIPFNTIYEADNTKNKNEKETVREGVNGEEKYKSLNDEDIPGSVRVTKEKVDKLVKVGTKPKEVITKLPSPIKYVKDDTKEKGLPNERIEGKTGTSTVITTYTVDPKTGEITENVGDPVTVNPTETIIKVPAKTKVERIKNGSKIIEKTTTYDVNPENGNITETVTEKIVSDNSPEKPPVLEVPEYTGPISTNTPVDEDGNLILPPVVDELPEYNGGVNSIEPPVEEKPEYKLPDKPKEEPIKEIPKEETKAEDKKEKELPNTNSTSILSSLVSSVIGTLGLGYKSKRRK